MAIKVKHVVLYNEKRWRCWSVNIDIATKLYKKVRIANMKLESYWTVNIFHK
jgi:hypothetical protein